MNRFLAIIVIFLMTMPVLAQVGDTDTPYATNGWDAPEAYSTYYNLPIYRLLSNPGGWININQRMVDSLFNALVVYTDTNQLYIENDTLKFSSNISGMDAFTTTAEYDTVVISGIDSLDVVIVSSREVVPSANDRLGVFLKSDTLIVGRPASGTSGLKYNWIWVSK